MNTVTNSSKVNPGYGYRLLEIGEVLQTSDEFRTSLYGWRKTCAAGEVVEARDHGDYRRKVTIPSGYRLVEENEKVKEGDLYLWETGVDADGGKCCVTIGDSAKSAADWMNHPQALAIVRPLPVAAPKPAIPAIDPGVGYRLLKVGEKIEAGDQFRAGIDGRWFDSGQYFVGQLPDIWINGTEIPCAWRRKVERKPEPKVFAGEGWRFLKAGEVIQEGDEVVPAFGGVFEVTGAVGETVKPVAGIAFPEGYYRRRIGVKTDELTATKAELKTAQDRIENLKTEKAELSDEIDHLKKQVESFKAESKKAHEVVQIRDRQIDAMQKNATGNAVLVRKDGFQRPMTVALGAMSIMVAVSNYGVNSFVSEGSFGPAYRSDEYRFTHKRDGFGRRIFEQV